MATRPSSAERVRHYWLHYLNDAHLICAYPGVLKAVSNVNDIIGPAIVKANLDMKDQKAVDQFMLDLDGTKNKGWFWAHGM